jgi:hypothetical protein
MKDVPAKTVFEKKRDRRRAGQAPLREEDRDRHRALEGRGRDPQGRLALDLAALVLRHEGSCPYGTQGRPSGPSKEMLGGSSSIEAGNLRRRGQDDEEA